LKDSFKISKVIVQVEKWKKDDYEKGKPPYETLKSEHNTFLNEGLNAMWTLVCGGTETPFDNANARVGVGNSNVAEDPTQTGLQGTLTAFASMDNGYPIYGSDQRGIFRGIFRDGEAEFSWEEFTVDNGETPNKNLNRTVIPKGTKPPNEVWRLTIELIGV